MALQTAYGNLEQRIQKRSADLVAANQGLVREIAERKQAQEALRESEEKFRTVVDHSPTKIHIKDLEGRYLLVNRKAEELFRVTDQEARGKTTLDLFPKAQAEAFQAHDLAVLKAGRALEREEEFVPDGGARTFLTVKFPIRDAGGEIVAIGAIGTDITERKMTEEHLRQSEKLKAIGQLTGGVAHDFNNLLAIILGNLELALERVDNDSELRLLLDPALRATQRGATLTQSLLAFSRKQTLQTRPIDLGELVHGLGDLFRRTLGATIEVRIVNSRDLWTCNVDPSQMQSALLNLAINARHAMPEGGTLTIEIGNAELGNEDSDAPNSVNAGEYVMLVVDDTGKGMSPEVREKAFEPFFTTKEVGMGSGMGLSMVYGFAKQSGGDVTIDSEEGTGTTVRLYLPRAKVPDRPATAETDAIESKGRGETILVVEDDASVRALIVSLLGSFGYEVMGAEDGQAALAALDGPVVVDLVLSDVVLPGRMSGSDVVEEVIRRHPDVKALLMSGYAADAVFHASNMNASVPLLNKPFEKAELARKIREALDHQMVDA